MVRISDASQERLWKGILAFLFLLLSVALIITWNSPATSYESSIYWSTPLIFWVSIIASVIAGSGLVVLTIAKNELRKHQLWKAGLLLIVLSYVTCLSLFIIRGYYMWCMAGDPASHIGWIKETMVMGYAPADILYPGMHIYLSEILFISGLDWILLHKTIPFLFSLLFIAYMYILAKAIFSNTSVTLLVVIVACAIPNTDFYLNLIPNGLSSLLLPLMLYTIFKYIQKKNMVWAIILFPLIILYPVFHPVPTMFIALVLLTLGIPQGILIVNQYVHTKMININAIKSYYIKIVSPMLILIVWFIFWISAFWAWRFSIRSIYESLTSDGTRSEGMDLMETMSYAQELGYNVIEIIIRQYGVTMVLFALSLIGLLSVMISTYHGRYNKWLLLLSGPFIALTIIMPILFLFDLPFNAFRFLHPFMLLLSIFSAYAFYLIIMGIKMIGSLHRRTMSSVLVIMMITGLIFAGFMTLYPSPYKLGISYHNPKSEVVGMLYYYEYRDINTPLSGISVAPGRFSNVFLTPQERSGQRLPQYLEKEDIIPWRFGYNVYSSIRFLYDKETDVIITERDKSIYKDIFPDIAESRFTELDFNHLKFDPAINSIYTNGGLDMFKIM